MEDKSRVQLWFFCLHISESKLFTDHSSYDGSTAGCNKRRQSKRGVRCKKKKIQEKMMTKGKVNVYVYDCGNPEVRRQPRTTA